MADLLNTAPLYDVANDDIIIDELCDVEDSSLLDLPADVGEFSGFDAWSDVEDNPLFVDSHNEIDENSERRNMSDSTMDESLGLTVGTREPRISVGLRQNLSKNAILARENREKKKRYVRGLEKTVRELSVKNKKLARGSVALRNTIADLRREVNYLRGVIENQSELARLLKRIPTVDPTCHLQVHASSSCDDEPKAGNMPRCNDHSLSASGLGTTDGTEFVCAKSAPTSDSLLIEHDYAKSQSQYKQARSSRRQFGVCLHVANQLTSVQLCASCNESAQ